MTAAQAWRALVTGCTWLMIGLAGLVVVFVLVALVRSLVEGYWWALIGLWPVPVAIWFIRRRRG